VSRLRQLLALGFLLGLAACRGQPRPASVDAGGDAAGPPPLRLADFKPRSMLHAAKHEVPRAKFPVIDFHQHVNDVLGPDGKLPYPAADLIKVMDAANVRMLVVLTGPSGDSLSKLLAALVKPHPDRFVVFTQVDWTKIDEPDFAEKAVARLRDDVARGARGLKVLKTLGLYARHKDGKLVAVDDPRIDPIWAEAGRLEIPVAIHTGDPEAFFHPRDGHNERYEELWVNPDWSFAGPGFPSLESMLEARDRVIARHPNTKFVALHVGGWPENLDYVSSVLDRFPNAYVELGARQAELGRQPKRTRKLFLDHPDRVLFGTDFTPDASLYSNFFRWLETEDECFPYFNHPEQGRWEIYGVGLPDAVLEKVYRLNAERVLGVKAEAR
jgi:predicted TIM-barrel fold metal-dependent hydrolase